MRYCFLPLAVPMAVVMVAGVCLAADVGGDAAKTYWRAGGTTSDWNSQVSLAHLPAADLHGNPGDAGISDVRIKIARNMKLDEHLTLTLGGGYGIKQIEAPSQAALPQDLHALFIEVGASYRINDRAFVNLKLYPGFYSDFKELGDDDLRMPVLALGGYTFNNGISVVGGFVYRFGYHANQYIPALGLSYQPNRNWRLDLVAPRPAITYFASERLQLFAGGDFASDEYQLNDRSLAAKAIKYGDLKAMAGFSYLPVPEMKFTTSVGYAFERKFMFFEGSRPDVRLDDVPFFKLSLDVGW